MGAALKGFMLSSVLWDLFYAVNSFLTLSYIANPIPFHLVKFL